MTPEIIVQSNTLIQLKPKIDELQKRLARYVKTSSILDPTAEDGEKGKGMRKPKRPRSSP